MVARWALQLACLTERSKHNCSCGQTHQTGHHQKSCLTDLVEGVMSKLRSAMPDKPFKSATAEMKKGGDRPVPDLPSQGQDLQGLICRSEANV